MTKENLLMVGGGVLALGGIALGLTQVSAGVATCGSAFTGGYIEDLTNAVTLPGFPFEFCQAARDARRWQALALLIPGVTALLVGAWLAYGRWVATPVSAKPQGSGGV